MQTLGLASEEKRTDGWLKSIFWPAVDNAWDVDYLGQQGYWICVLIAFSQIAIAGITGKAVLMAVGVVAALLYFAGGNGVRQKSWPAAALISFCYLLDTLVAVLTGMLLTPIGAVRVVFLGLLLSNVRATFIASEWKPPAEGEDSPSRFAETLRDKLVDVWPPRIWAAVQIPFYVLGGVWAFLSLLGLAGAVVMRLGLLSAPGSR